MNINGRVSIPVWALVTVLLVVSAGVGGWMIGRHQERNNAIDNTVAQLEAIHKKFSDDPAFDFVVRTLYMSAPRSSRLANDSNAPNVDDIRVSNGLADIKLPSTKPTTR